MCRVAQSATTRSTRLAVVGDAGAERIGRFEFLPEGLTLGKTALEQAVTAAHQLVIVDEVGRLELRGHGWASQLDRLADRRGFTLFTVRRELATQVAGRWGALSQAQFDVARGVDAAVDALMELIESHQS